MKTKLFMLLSFCLTVAFAQSQTQPTKPDYIGELQLVTVTPSLSSKMDQLVSTPTTGEARDGRYSKTRRPKREVIAGKGSTGDLLSKNPHLLTGSVKVNSADAVWDAGYTGSNPTDPALAVGPEHVFVVWNTKFAIFDKDGNELVGPTNPNPAIFPSNGCCDLTVSYDTAADRWIISYLGGGAQIAVSQTGNPITSDWNIYNIGSVNDYNKLSVWSDGYYLTDQSNGNRLYAMDRAAMLAGAGSVSIQGFQLPGMATFGFASPQALNVTSGDMPAPGNAPIVFFQDNSYGGVSEDHIKFWSANVDFSTPGNSSITAPQQIPVTPFTSIFDGGSFSNLAQPNGGSLLDALQGIVMNQAQFRKFSTHNSAVFNHVIDIDPSGGGKRAAVRWYEFRQTSDGAPWTLYQEGTYASPEGKHAWNASLMMDNQGNIGMGYSAMSVQGNGNTEVGSYYTGRFASDPLGVMTVAEEVIAPGDAAISGGRYGDYSKIDIDPSDDATFYFTNEVHTADTPGNQRAANVGRFKIAPDANADAGIIAFVTPIDGDLSSTETVEVVVRNFGTVTQSNIEVSFTLDDGTPVTEVVAGPIAPASNINYTFTATVDMSVDGQTYNLCARTNLSGDEIPDNDEFCSDVTSLLGLDTGVVAITSPVTESGLSDAEVVTIEIENFGTITQTSIPVFYSLDGAAPVNETYTGSIAQGATDTYSFTTTVDLSELTDYVFVAGTELPGDDNPSNDDTTAEVSNFLCQPETNCTLGDGLTLVSVEEINNPSGCETDGYGDFTDLIANLAQGGTYDITLSTGYGNQFVKVWVDYNDDFTFSNNEVILNNYVIAPGSNAGNYTETTSMTIPANATLGSHRMRIKTNWNANVPVDACEETTYGETEDYTANITDELGLNESFYDADFVISSQDQNYFDLNFKSPSYTNDLPVYVINTLGQTLAYYVLEYNGTGFSKTIDMSYVSSGVYFIKIGSESLNKVQRIIVK
ncbi:T9SS type A sorting domain-containing protein [Flavobacteriaceae bacterium]|nr:T9SS type A sorting domain-containing protein [Flavobacteriaceae bacterium]